ncbi:hypothetical protein [Streptomyces virginiae]|uniref:hypothetical protein n=1 Tax=Streptomyces virginiae TaxID=1961 RepID=UPI00324D6E13
MYLVHAHLQAPPGGALPPDTPSLVWAQAYLDEGLEHVVAHPCALPHPVLGFYVRAENLTAAELKAHELCRRLLDRVEFAGWSLVRAEAPMVALFYESLLSRSGNAAGAVDGTVRGPLRPEEPPSSPPDGRRK